MHADASSSRRGRRSSAAPSSRRSARRSPKCDRSPSTAARGSGVGTLLVDELRRARAARASRSCARSRTRRLLHPDGLLDRAAPLAAEKIFTDCVKCPQFRSAASTRWWCRSTRSPTRPARRRRRRARHADADRQSTSRAASRRRRVSRGGRQRRHQGQRRPRPRAARLGHAGHGGRGVHDQPGAGGAGPRLARAPRASGGTARAIVVNSGCANACTGDEGMPDARDMASETARLVGCPVEQVLVASTGVIGVGAADRQDPTRRCRAAFAALGARSGRRRPRAPS